MANKRHKRMKHLSEFSRHGVPKDSQSMDEVMKIEAKLRYDEAHVCDPSYNPDGWLEIYNVWKETAKEKVDIDEKTRQAMEKAWNDDEAFRRQREEGFNRLLLGNDVYEILAKQNP